MRVPCCFTFLFARRLHQIVETWLVVCLAAIFAPGAIAQTILDQTPLAQHNVESDRVTAQINLSDTTLLKGHLPAWVRPEADAGQVPSDLQLDNMIVVLRRSASREQAYQQLLQEQHTPGSPEYHHWLTPQQLGAQYGVTQHDIAAITSWLQSQGLHVKSVSPSNMFITFSGSVWAVETALSTEFHYYKVYTTQDGTNQSRQLIAIDAEPKVPAALAPVIHGFWGMSQSTAHPLIQSQALPKAVSPQDSWNCGLLGNCQHYISPADFATIYDISPIYNNGTLGMGQQIAIIGRSQVANSDIEEFEANTGLPKNDPVPEPTPGSVDPGYNGVDPGYTNNDDQLEATLDVERAVGTAPDATIFLIVSADNTTVFDGIQQMVGGNLIALMYELSTIRAPIASMSYANCEADFGEQDTKALDELYSEGASEGITIFVGAGDSGAYGCASALSSPPITQTLNTNAFCSSGYVTCVGGTEFNDTANPSQYWSSSNGNELSSALRYIPEGGWNEPINQSTGAYQLAASGGGVSSYITKPAWQAGTGVPSDGYRDTPDIAFSASVHDAYYGCVAFTGGDCSKGSFQPLTGTSAATPSMAGIMALINQLYGGSSQGNINPGLYKLASTHPSVFHDATVATSGVTDCSLNTPSMCNNSTPSPTSLTGGLAGYQLNTGYDLVTGLGSLDVSQLSLYFGYAETPKITSWEVTPTSVSLGGTVSIDYTASSSGGTELSRAELWRAPDANGQPGTWPSSPLQVQSLTGSGPTQVAFTDTPSAAGQYWYGTHLFDVAGNEAVEPAPIQVTVGPATQAPSVALQVSPMQAVVGSSITLTATVSSSIGTPTGTVTFYDGSISISPAIAINNAGMASYNISSLNPGSHSISARYSGNSSFQASESSPISVTVTSISPQISVSPQNGVLGVTSFTKSGTGFTPNGPITHTATWPDNTKSILNGYADSTGSFNYPVTYSGETGTYYQTDTDNTSGKSSNTITWTVSSSVVNSFSLTASPNSQYLSQGSTAAYNVVTATTGGSFQTISLSATNLPSGVSASFSPATITSGGQSSLTLTAASSAELGTFTLIITGTGSSTSQTSQVSVTVTQAPNGPAATVTPSIVRFNSQAVGSVSSPETVMLLNSGSGQLVINSIALAAGSDYLLSLPSGSFPYILNASVPYNLQVSFDPTATGTRPGQLLIYDNAPNSPQVVTLTGSGTTTQAGTGAINVTATLNGNALPSDYYYSYTLNGPVSYSGVGANSFAVQPGTYAIAFSNPSYLTLTSVSPASTQDVVAGGSVTFTLNFTAPNDFYAPSFLMTNNLPTPQIVPGGSTATYSIGLGQPIGNPSTPITLSVAGVPAEATATFNPEPAYSATASTLSIATSSATDPGVYTLSLSGTNTSGVTHGGSTSSLAVTTLPSVAVQLVGQSSTGVEENAAGGISTPAAMSSDGRYVVFNSTASNLVSSGGSGIFVRDRQAGNTILASVSNSGVAADGYFGESSISANGQFVIFSSSTDNFGLGSNTSGNRSVYVRDIVNDITEREDIATDGTAANGDSYLVAISADGRYAAFESNASNLAGGASGYQAYLHDRKTGETTLVSVADDGTPANGGVSSLAISADGRFVAFDSSATNLVSQSTIGTQTYLRDVVNGTTTLVSASSSGAAANARVDDSSGGSFGNIAMSADGRYIVFNSTATNLVPQSLDGTVFHVFLHDMETGQNTLVDTDSSSSGAPLGGWSAFSFPGISADGRFVSFDGFEQVLVRDMVAQRTEVVSLAANGAPGNNITAGSNPETSVSPGGGSVAFLSSATNLVPNDTNGVADVFVAQNPLLGPSSAQSITLNSSTVLGGSNASGTITLSGAAPTGGATVAVWANNPAVQPPTEIIVPAGATSAPLNITTSLVSAETVVTILASYNGGVGIAVLTLEPAAELSVSPATWDFGSQAVGTSSAGQSFTLTNSGTSSLAINFVQLATGQAFKISENTCGTSIAAGGGCSISVTFDPSVLGSASDAVQISYGSPTTIFSISLTGNGATPVVTLTPTPLSFGNQSMPGSSTAVATLTNSGNASLSSIAASISGTNSGDFSISSDGCSGVILPANSSCLISVSFSPKSKGSRIATLSIADSASGSPQTTGLSGIGVQSTPIVQWAPSLASLTYGMPLGTGILDATASLNGSSVAGSFAYTAALNGGAPQTVTQATVLMAGSYALTTTFTPTDTTDYTNGTATVSITVNTATPIVTVTPNSLSIFATQALTLKVSVNGKTGSTAPTGTVTLTGGGYSSSAMPLTNGAATINIAAGALATGTDALTVNYSGDTNYSAATGSANVTVTAAIGSTAATVTVTPSALTITNQQTDPVKVTVAGASGQPTPTGTVTLTSGNYSAQQPLASGAANFTIPADALSSGSDTLTAAYSGDTTYGTATGTATIMVAQVAISLPAPSAVSPGANATATATLTAGSGYSGTMNLSCTLASSPAGAQSLPTCSLNPTSVTLKTSGTATSTLTVTTTAASTSAFARPYGRSLWQLGGGSTVLAALLLFGIPSRRRRWLSMLVLLCIVAAVGLSSCGGGSGSSTSGGGSTIQATTAGNYTFTVTGTDSVNSQITTSTSVSVTVQ